jgi:hypothetical protein
MMSEKFGRFCVAFGATLCIVFLTTVSAVIAEGPPGGSAGGCIDGGGVVTCSGRLPANGCGWGWCWVDPNFPGVTDCDCEINPGMPGTCYCEAK